MKRGGGTMFKSRSKRHLKQKHGQPDPDSDVPAIVLLRRIKRTVTLIVKLCLLLLFLGGAGLAYLRVDSLPVSDTQQTSQVFDINGALIDSLNTGQNRQPVPLSEISKYAVQATLATEDKRFYSHFGVDPKGIMRAVFVNLQHFSKIQGAGTITQQLARNLYLTHERTWTRKIKESIYAIQLELQWSKDQILEQYLNQIYFGHSTYGIESASQMFFGKSSKDLTLAESALLIGVPKGPRYYSPYYDKESSLARQKTVLALMVTAGYISQTEADQATRENLYIKPLEARKPPTAPYFRDYIRTVAIDKLGLPEALFDGGGVRIYTTLDLRAQQIAENVVKDNLKDKGELQSALVAIDPRNGYIKAMVGGKDYAENQFNRVFASTRQPGSSFKPIMYLTALERGFTPLTQYKSEPTIFTYDEGRNTYAPSNYGNKYSGEWMDMRQAIAQSDNIYAVNTVMGVGPDKVIETARKMGIDSELKPLPSLALGTFPVSPFEMASAFSVLADGGTRHEPVAILWIENAAGKVLYEAQPQALRVADAASAYVLTQLMTSVFEEGGTGNRVSALLKRPVAGKTGTTNSDAWMVGYTPELATAVWVGYDKGRTIGTVESHLAAPIFAEFTEQTLESVPPKDFDIPEGIVSVFIDPASGKLANADCQSNARIETFISGTEPSAYCTDRGSKGAGKNDGATDKSKRSWWNDFKQWLNN
jgi:1A family penicillin-binding protein